MKEIWMRADVPDNADARKKMVISGLESGIGTFIVRPGDEKAFSSLGKMEFIVNDGGKLKGYASGRIVNVTTPKEQKEAMELCGKEKYIVVSTGDWSVIPLENLIAASSSTKIMACVSSADDAELCHNILEKGTDGIVISVDDADNVKSVAERAKTAPGLELTSVKVVSVKNIQTGDRVCVDTCSSMIPGEGMLIGSQSSCLFLVQSESEENGYVASRPFRVNAGAVHAYIMTPDGKTRYLSELSAGDDVLIVDKKGKTRTASVGRCKNEIRPMLIVSVAHNGKEYTTILQNAETVKLVTPDGSVSVSELKKGDDVLVHLAEGGRHFGMPVNERIRES